jgi:hypothetical protein
MTHGACGGGCLCFACVDFVHCVALVALARDCVGVQVM